MELEDYKKELSECTMLLSRYNDLINELRIMKKSGVLSIDDGIEYIKSFRFMVSQRAEQLHSEFHNLVK